MHDGRPGARSSFEMTTDREFGRWSVTTGCATPTSLRPGAVPSSSCDDVTLVETVVGSANTAINLP